jgi:oxygen-dependent protoporphyrinogen oxidase
MVSLALRDCGAASIERTGDKIAGVTKHRWRCESACGFRGAEVRRPTTMSSPTVIIGAGISGLSAAYRLARHGLPSIVLDPRPRPGGVIETVRVNDFTIEGGPDSFLAAKPDALALIRELGLESDVIASNDYQRKTYIRKRGRMVEMPDGLMMVVPTKILPMARSPLLGWSTKLRMGLEFFRRPGPKQPDRSIADFIEDHYGIETVDYLAEPLLSGVYGGDPRNLSVRSVLPRFADLADRYGSLTRGVIANRPKQSGGALFRTLQGGLGQLVSAIVASVDGVAEFRRAAAETIEPIAGGFRIRADGQWLEASQIVVACEAFNAAALLRNSTADGRLAHLLGGIAYSSSVIVAFAYDGPPPMPGFGFLIPRKERRQIAACTWVGTKFDHRVPAGKTVARCFLGGDREPDPLAIHRELQDLTGLRAEPLFHRIFRWPRAMAQYEVGHAGRIAEIQSLAGQLPGLHLIGNAYTGIGIPDCIRMGKSAAESIIGAT